MAENAVEIEPHAAGIWDTLGWLYYEKGELDKAIIAMQKTVTLDPESDYFKKNLDKLKQPV